ncbi:MAG: hypothetical protein DDT39_01335 [Firmicutes bacterium]|nr:hypothetical protein [candidate division NPL-UPA2 bacterium]
MTAQERGCPGRPTTNLPEAIANTVGFPGFTANPCTKSSADGNLSMALVVKSKTPAELPPDSTRASHSARPRAKASASHASSSRMMPKYTGVRPRLAKREVRYGELQSLICPACGTRSRGTTSSPVAIMPTLNDFTRTLVIPCVANTAILEGDRHWPAATSVVPSSTSSPTSITFSPGATGRVTIMVSECTCSAYSCITTAS